jgi:hypothetical protein
MVSGEWRDFRFAGAGMESGVVHVFDEMGGLGRSLLG